MDHLKKDIGAMIHHVQSLPPNPTTEQLSTKVTSLCQAVLKDSLALPIRIKEIVQEAFGVLGWDVSKNKIANPTLLSVEHLLQCLQTILDEVTNWSPPVIPTPDEITSLSLACERLWDLDSNRLSPGTDYAIDLQQGKTAYQVGDVAPDPFFKFVHEDVFKRPTFKAFIALFDNYFADTGISEVVTDEELTENRKFLELIMDTAVMQYLHQYLLSTHKTRHSDRKEFIKELDKIWFGLYSRKAKNDSSGFEHVFIGEVKDGVEISGFHNWIRIYLEEKANRFNYLGYIRPRKRGLHVDYPSEHEQVISMQFEWNGAKKLVSTSLIGTSPEFEIALYTLCFYSGQCENIVQIGPYKILMTSYTWPIHPHPGQQVYIATSFPSEVPSEGSPRSGKH